MATRTIGFSLKVLGTNQTLAQIEQINKKLDETRAKIMAVSAPIKLNTVIDTKGLNDLNPIIDKVSRAKLSPEIKSQIKSLQSELQKLQAELKAAQSELAKVKSPTLNGNEVKAVNGHLKEMNGHAKLSVVAIEQISPALKNIGTPDVLALAEALAKVQQNLDKVRSEKLTVKADKNITAQTQANLLAPLIAQEKELQQQQQQVTKELNLQTKAFLQQAQSIPKDSIVALEVELSKLTKQYRELGKAELEGAKGQAIQTQLAAVTQEISAREQAVGNFRRNVGNYANAVRGIIPELEGLQREGILAQKNMAAIFKADLVAQGNKLEQEIKELAEQFTKLGTSIDTAGERAKVLSQIDDRARELASVRGALDQTTASFERLGGKLLTVSDIVTGGLIGGGILATAAALKTFGAGAFEEFKQAETSIAKINRQLVVTGNSSGQSAEGLQNMAKELEVLTGIDGDQILNDVTSSLLKFTNIQGQVFGEAQKAALDLSATLGGDLAGAAQIVGKALDNPLKGLTLLQKQGITFNEETKKAVEQAVKQNDALKAQQIILTELGKRFAGVAEAVNQTDLQGIREFTVAWNNFKESVGKGLVSAFNSVFNAIKDFSNGVDIFDRANLTLNRGVKTFENTVIEEVSSIRNLTNALKDETISRQQRDKLIEGLVAKYPGLIEKYDLEYASIERLDEIQKQLTATVYEQVRERLKAQTKEALEIQKITKSTEIAKILSGQLSFGQRFAAGLEGLTKDQAVKKFVDQLEDDIRALDLQSKNLDATFAQQDEILSKALGLPKTAQSLNTVSRLNTLISAVFGETEKILNDAKASEAAKAYARSLQREFVSIEQTIQRGVTDENTRQNLINQAIGGLKKLQGLSATKIQLPGSEDDFEKTKKNLDDQIKLLEEIRKKVNEIKTVKAQADIENVFDKQLAEARAKANADLNAFEKQRQEILNKKVLNQNDKLAIEEIAKLYIAVQEKLQQDEAAIEANRQKVLDAAKKGLLEAKNEVSKIINSINDTEINIELKQSEFELDQAKRNIEVEFQSNIQSFRDQLNQGSISIEEFDKKVIDAETQKLEAIDKLYQKKIGEILDKLREKAKQERVIAETERDAVKAVVVEKYEEELKNIQAALDKGEVTPDVAFAKRVLAQQKLYADLGKADVDYKNKKQEIDQNLKQSEDTLRDQGLAAHEATEASKTAVSREEAQKRLEYEKERLQEIKQAALDFASELSSSLFEIEDNRINRQAEAQRSSIEKEYDNRLKLVKGNSAEEERIEREKDAKIAEVDKKAAERRKKLAIFEATIQTALNVIKSLDKPYLIPFIIAAGALQIAKIRSASFAKGRYFNTRGRGGFTGAGIAPADESGERPIGTAILHEDEYIGTRKQTRRHPAVFEILDKDRIKTNSGQPSTLIPDLAEYIQRTRAAIHSIPGESLRPEYKPIIPVVLPFDRNSKQEIRFSDEQIETMAMVMAGIIAERSGAAIFNGSKEGISQAAKQAIREELTAKRAKV